MKKLLQALAIPALISTSVLAEETTQASIQAPIKAAEAAKSTESADAFVARVNAELDEMSAELGAINWVRATYINGDTAIIAARAQERYAAWHSRTVKEAQQFEGQPMSAETARALKLLKLGTSAPAPSDPARRKELAEVTTELSGLYGAGKYCPEDGRDCMAGTELEELIANSRDYDEALDYWLGWRQVSVPMRNLYVRYAELLNEGASELGYSDLGEMWRDDYDMSPAAFKGETERLWQQVKPLYDELHCHVRATLAEHYGEDKVSLDKPIPAHLLGNMWAQTWDRIYDLLKPYPDAPALDVTETLVANNYSPEDMVRSAESFYVSMGLEPLPATFWERSQFSKPRDREVQCHASAWGLDGGRDLRIKMCINQTYDELKVIYHELGHNYYQYAYRDQPPLFRDGAHGGFHEAIGDTVVLAMTPDYLKRAGLVDKVEDSHEALINDQMLRALRGIAVLPWAKLVDEWRWGVFSGEIKPTDYNRAWWELREKYQGVAAPVARSEADFDPGAKYHIPGNVSYTRYFLARILQYQFLETLCDAAGYQGELHACSFEGSKQAGNRLNAMLAEGVSQPWQDTLEKLTGTRQMDGSAIIAYYQPLMRYLRERNSGRQCGW
ncbi:MAG: M2 family metallopeptidase [Parahaliea sp.]